MNLPSAEHDRRRLAVAALTAGALAIALWHAGTLAWVKDDCFITFRYAKNFVEGKGLVFNPGEPAGGYTNFLRTMMIAGGMVAGFDPDLAIECETGLTDTFITHRALQVRGRPGHE